MTKFENFQSKTIDELATFLDKCGDLEVAPWIEWWDKNYCSKCQREYAETPLFERQMKFAWCELHGQCKYFLDMQKVPDTQEIIKMWLESEMEA